MSRTKIREIGKCAKNVQNKQQQHQSRTKTPTNTTKLTTAHTVDFFWKRFTFLTVAVFQTCDSLPKKHHRHFRLRSHEIMT